MLIYTTSLSPHSLKASSARAAGKAQNTVLAIWNIIGPGEMLRHAYAAGPQAGQAEEQAKRAAATTPE